MSLRDAEFLALRQTIAWRGTARMVLVPLVLFGWAGLWTGLFLAGERGIATTLPLLVLAGGYEAVHALHVGVERIGRYLQLWHEGSAEGPAWESAAMRLGPGLPGGGIDPLFTVLFILATVANLLLALPRISDELLPVLLLLAVHGALIARAVRARRAAGRQRVADLERLRSIRTDLLRSPASGPGVR